MEPDSSFTLSRVIDMDVGNHRSALDAISDQATKEAAVEKALKSMQDEWSTLELSMEERGDGENASAGTCLHQVGQEALTVWQSGFRVQGV